MTKTTVEVEYYRYGEEPVFIVVPVSSVRGCDHINTYEEYAEVGTCNRPCHPYPHLPRCNPGITEGCEPRICLQPGEVPPVSVE